MEQNYVFRVGQYDSRLLIPQVSKALELRMDLVSKKRYPGLWAATDKLRSFSHGRTRSRTRSRIMGILFLFLGIFLFVPGLTDPEELTGPLLIGALGILAGIFNLWSSRKNKKNPFDRSAKLFLDNISPLSQDIEVVFGESGVEMPGESIPYENFECAVQGPDIFLFTFDTRATVLQKCDLIAGEADEFWLHISGKISQNASFS